MAEKAEKKPEAPAAAEGGEKAKKAGLLTKLPVLLGGTMVIEAVLIVGVVKFLGGSAKPAHADTEISSPEGEKTGADKKEGGDEKAAAEGGDKKEAGKEGEKAAEGEAKAGEPAKGESKGEGKGEEKGGLKARAPKSPFVEIELTSFRAPNSQSGHRIVYDVSIYAKVKRANEDKIKALVKDRKATIEDRVRTIIATLDPEKLGGGSEPGLETLRRQVKYAMDEVAGESIVDEVLVSRCLPFRGD